MPILFELGYNWAQILAKHKYGIAIRISKDGTLLFVNDIAFPVLNDGPSTGVNVVVYPPMRR